MTSTQPLELFRSKLICKLNHSCPSTSCIIVDLVIPFLMIKHVLVRMNAFCWRRTWCPPLVMALLSMTNLNSTVSLQPPLSSTLTPRLWLRTESFQQLHSLFFSLFITKLNISTHQISPITSNMFYQIFGFVTSNWELKLKSFIADVVTVNNFRVNSHISTVSFKDSHDSHLG